MRKRVKAENIKEGRGIAGVIEDTERGVNEFGTEDTRQPFHQIDINSGRLNGRLAKSRGRGRRGKK